MKYINQVVVVTQWEFRRFFKPRNEAMGIVVMLLIFLISYFGGRLALSGSDEKPVVYVLQPEDTSLLQLLNADFLARKTGQAGKMQALDSISQLKKGFLVEQKDGQYQVYAYKKSRELKKLKGVLDAHYRAHMMQSKGWKEADLSAVLAPAPVSEEFMTDDHSNNRIVLAFFFAGLMILAVFLSFAYQFTAITGEKQLKITEQIVSAITPQCWMDGKIFGITLTGLASMLTYSAMGVIGGILFFQFTGVPVSAITGYLHLPSILLFFPFALAGILMWNAMMAAVASVITDPNNSGKSPLMMLPLLFVAASFLVTRDPDSPMAVFLSWFPLTSPTAMPMRWALTGLSLWQPAVSFLVLLLAFYLLRKLAAKVFRVSVLLSGKEPGWSEIFRLVKNTD